MSPNTILRIAFRTAGIYVLVRAATELPSFAIFFRHGGPPFWEGSSGEYQVASIVGLLFMLGASAYLMRGAPHFLRFSKAESQPFTAPVGPKIVLPIICRLFGVFFTAQMLMALPGFFFSLMQLLQSQGPGISGPSSANQFAFNHTALTLAIHTALAAYLLRGAAHLVQFMKLDEEK